MFKKKLRIYFLKCQDIKKKLVYTHNTHFEKIFQSAWFEPKLNILWKIFKMSFVQNNLTPFEKKIQCVATYQSPCLVHVLVSKFAERGFFFSLWLSIFGNIEKQRKYSGFYMLLNNFKFTKNNLPKFRMK